MVFGTPEDRRAFTTAIRAFALAGRWGDRLTLVGAGAHRRQLEKWIRALRIEGVVAFVEHGFPSAESVVGHDVAILVSRRPDQTAILLYALLDGLRILATDENAAAAELLRQGPVGALFQPRDVTGLTHAMLVVEEPDPAAVQRLLAAYVAPDASCALALRL